MLKNLFIYICCLSIHVQAMEPGQHGIEDSIAEYLTIITTTHPIPSNPSTDMLERTQKSLFRIPAFRDCHKIIVFDDVAKDLDSLKNHIPSRELENKTLRNVVIERYEKFKENVKALTQTNPYFSNTTLLFCKEHLHLAFSIGEALKTVTTPFVFIHQHDFELVKDFDATNIIRSMLLNPNLKHVRVSILGNTEDPWWQSLVDDHIEGGSLVPLLRSDLWVDNDHFSPVTYYTDFILPKLPPKSCMEWFLCPEEKEEIRKDISNHLKYGTYIYGQKGDEAYLGDLDGSRRYRGDDWEY